MIGIFDSGLGGLTVAKAVMEALPQHRIIYFGDTARGPFGNKPPEVVMQYAIENARFLLKKKAKVLVVGCNTASAVAGTRLRKEFPKVPIFEVITPAVREALRVSREGKIAVIGTRTTVQSGAYQKWCRGIEAQACPLFVPLVEAGHLDHPTTNEVARHYLNPLKQSGVDTLILGCTHYPMLTAVISKIMGRSVQLVNSAETVAREVAESFKRESLPYRQAGMKILKQKQLKHEFYVSKKTKKFQEIAEKWLGTRINLKLAKM